MIRSLVLLLSVTSISYQVSGYLSDITDIIQQVDNVQPGRFQLQNAGNAMFHGYEVSANYELIKGLAIGSNYTYIYRKNNTNPDLFFMNVPNHKYFGFVDYNFLKHANIMASVENNSKRYSTSYGTSTPGYALVNTRGSVQVYKYVTIEAGISNIFDKNYSLLDGFPEAGRNYFVNLVFKNL